jgi:hypothetical protein
MATIGLEAVQASFRAKLPLGGPVTDEAKATVTLIATIQCRCARVCPSHVLSFLLKGAATPPTLIALGRVGIHRRWNGSEFCRQAYEFRLRSNPAGVLRRCWSSFRVWWVDKPVVSDCDRSAGRLSISGLLQPVCDTRSDYALCPSVFTPQIIVRMRKLAENGKSASEITLVIGATPPANHLS